MERLEQPNWDLTVQTPGTNQDYFFLKGLQSRLSWRKKAHRHAGSK
jgi:hypothetical protein